jgi:hypothetical protein
MNLELIKNREFECHFISHIDGGEIRHIGKCRLVYHIFSGSITRITLGFDGVKSNDIFN